MSNMNASGVSVSGVNLLSPARRERARRRLLTRRWAGGLVIYALTLGGLSLTALLSSRVPTSTESEMATLRTELSGSEGQLKTLLTQQADLRKRVNAARAVGHHPDWSVLLRMIASRRGEAMTFDEVMLTHRVETSAPERKSDGKPAPVVRREFYDLTLAGVTDHVRSVNTFVVALEESGLFDRVRRVESNAPDARGTYFRVICTMRDGQDVTEEKQR